MVEIEQAKEQNKKIISPVKALDIICKERNVPKPRYSEDWKKGSQCYWGKDTNGKDIYGIFVFVGNNFVKVGVGENVPLAKERAAMKMCKFLKGKSIMMEPDKEFLLDFTTEKGQSKRCKVKITKIPKPAVDPLPLLTRACQLREYKDPVYSVVNSEDGMRAVCTVVSPLGVIYQQEGEGKCGKSAQRAAGYKMLKRIIADEKCPYGVWGSHMLQLHKIPQV